MKENFHVRFGERGGETRRPQGRKVRSAPTLRSGNFLYLALISLLDLWKEVYNLMLALGLTPISPLEGISPTPGQLHGIEINPYAYELAQATIWIGYIQWLRDNGFGLPSEPILRPIQTVQRMDAIMAGDGDQGTGVREPEWPAADVIIGNPPFLGGGKIRAELGDAYTEALFKLYGDRLPNFSDLCCYWFEKARAQIAFGKARRAGLLATQGIRGGANRKVLERIKETGDIFWAQSDRDWVLDGANVHVSMVGFDDGSEQERWLNDQAVITINPDLTAAIDFTQAQTLPENVALAFRGNQKGGAFDISSSLASQMLLAPVNPNGRPNHYVLKRTVNGSDITGRDRRVWLIDFGVDCSLEEAARYEMPFEHILKTVFPVRGKTHPRWWIHERPRPRCAQRSHTSPDTSLHRMYQSIGCSLGWITSFFPITNSSCLPRSDEYFFGVLHSRAHELWALRMGTQLREAESGFRYTPTTCFETFPFPWPPGQEPADDPRVQAISQAAQELVQLRDAWLNPPDLTGLGDLSGLAGAHPHQPLQRAAHLAGQRASQARRGGLRRLRLARDALRRGNPGAAAGAQSGARRRQTGGIAVHR